jgi:hypothetical protein
VIILIIWPKLKKAIKKFHNPPKSNLFKPK